MNVLLVLAVLSVVILGLYALYLWRQVWLQQKQQQQQLAKNKQDQIKKEQDHQQYLIKSIAVISQSAVNGELNCSEACIRLKVLLDNLDVDEQKKAPFLFFDEIYMQLQQFHTHKARLQLSEKERISEDRKRHFIELKNQAELTRLFTLLTQTQWH